MSDYGLLLPWWPLSERERERERPISDWDRCAGDGAEWSSTSCSLSVNQPCLHMLCLPHPCCRVLTTAHSTALLCSLAPRGLCLVTLYPDTPLRPSSPLCFTCSEQNLSWIPPQTRLYISKAQRLHWSFTRCHLSVFSRWTQIAFSIS